MKKLMNKQAQLERSSNRVRLFEENRKFFAFHFNQQYPTNSTIIQTINSTEQELNFIETGYSVVIQTLSLHTYKPTQIPTLINLLKNKNIFSNYQAVIGIYHFGGNLFNPQNQLQILGSGIVPQLSKLFFQTQHPFLQLRSLNILLTIMEKMRGDRFTIFFNRTIIPYPSLLILLNSQFSCVSENCLKMTIKLVKSNYNIQTDSSSLELLDVLSKLVIKWSNYKNGLQLIIQFMSHLQVYFWESRIAFTEKYFGIIAALIQQEQSSIYRSKILSKIFELIRHRKMIKKICNKLSYSLETAQINSPQIFKCLSLLFHYKLNAQSLNLDWWKLLIFTLMYNKQGFIVLEKLNFRAKIQQDLQQYQDTNIQAMLLELYGSLLGQILKTKDTIKIQSMIQNNKIYQRLALAYKKSSNKSIVRSLNSTVLQLIKTFKYQDSTKIFRQYDLIQLYIHNSGLYDCQSAKVATKFLKEAIQQMKNTPQIDKQRYKGFVSLVLSQQQYKEIISMLRGNYCMGTDDIMKFFQTLKQQFQKIQKQELYNTISKGVFIEKQPQSQISIKAKQQNVFDYRDLIQ